MAQFASRKPIFSNILETVCQVYKQQAQVNQSEKIEKQELISKKTKALIKIE